MVDWVPDREAIERLGRTVSAHVAATVAADGLDDEQRRLRLGVGALALLGAPMLLSEGPPVAPTTLVELTGGIARRQADSPTWPPGRAGPRRHC
jgi:hypothetical protein